jgi:tetratricopeptide (TPR) repeat protein
MLKGMRPLLLGALLLAGSGCYKLFADETSDSDRELSSFAEARQRAATFYEGQDYVRATAQYREALKLRPDHFMCRLGLAYSLMYTNLPSTLVDAEKEFTATGERRDPKEEVKRVYGLGLTYRTLAGHYRKRSLLREDKGQVKGAAEDAAMSREYAQKGIVQLQKVMELDQVLAKEQQFEPLRVSASLTPDAHLGIAHCEVVLMDPSEPDELKRHETRARENLKAYADIAANARKFWELRREQLLVIDPMSEQSQAVTPDAASRKRYEERIASTIRQEVAVRRALFETLLYVNRYQEAIEEATTVLGLDPSIDEVVRQRARAYLFLQPPDKRAALKDLKEYRSRLPVDRLTDEMVQLNRDIRQLERELAQEPPPDPPKAGS